MHRHCFLGRTLEEYFIVSLPKEDDPKLRLVRQLADVEAPPPDSCGGMTEQETFAYTKMKLLCANIINTLEPPMLKKIQESTLRAFA